MKQILEFLEYNKDKCTGILSMDVEGGFDKVNIDILYDNLTYRECEPVVVNWIRRWTIGRRIQLRFNERVSKEYNLNKGVPQGSPLSPFLFGVYVADMFKPRFSFRIGLRRIMTSYVDDGAILVSTNSVKNTKEEIRKTLGECKSIARSRGMDFSMKKMEWIGFGRKKWGELEVEEGKLEMTKEIRILGYRIDTDRKWKGHVEYWSERGMGVRRNVSNVSRRFGSKGGIGAWECLRMIRGVYLPTVCYGLEFITAEKTLVNLLQITINDTLRSILRAPLNYANKILYAETGIEPIEMMCREAERRDYERHVKYEYGKDTPWYGIIATRWKDDRIHKKIDYSDAVQRTKPKIIIEKDKEKAIRNHAERWETKPRDEQWVYTDGSKKDKNAAILWILMDGDELVEEENGMRVPGDWSITKIELCAIGMAMRDMMKLRKRKIRIFSDSMSGLMMIRDMEREGESAPL